MRIARHTTGIALVLAAVLGLAGPAWAAEAPAGAKDIVDTALAAGKFNTLAAALKAAGLIETLKGKGPFTVFAPTDEAFTKLPKGLVQRLLRPENKKQLTAILTFHVVPGRIVLGPRPLKTAEGSSVTIAPAKDITVNGIRVIAADIPASNGVIHVIDRVLVPATPKPTPSAEARGLIDLALKRGVPLFNDGKIDACAAIYEVAAQGLLRTEAGILTDADRKALQGALDEVADSKDARANAWTLRHALDQAYRSLRHKP